MVYTRYSELCRLRTFLWILGLGVLLLYATYKALNEGTFVSPGVIAAQADVLNESTNATVTVTKASTAKPFIYLTQTEQCLPQNLAASSQIGDPNTCNCDVIVLSYRTKCHEQNLSHVTYLFDPDTGWGSGRNALYFTAINRTQDYHYYIVLDDDAVLSFNEFTPPEMKKLQPFRAFEEWLLDYEPAVGVLNNKDHHGASWTFERRKQVCGITERSMVLPIVWFDGIFNSYHRKAIQHLFPYRVQYETISWWSLHRYMFTAVELKFRGQALMYVPVTSGNPAHRPYPRSLKNVQIYWREYIETIQQEAPLVYRNRSLFDHFKQNLAVYDITSSTYCINVTRHQPIVPFAHFERETKLN